MPIATVALVVSALVFAPLASYLAGRRARSALVWFGLGVVLGPLAVALLLLAPPGRCPECGTRVRGWPRTCDGCGAPLAGAIGWSRAAATAEPMPPRPVVIRSVGTTSVEATPPPTPRPVLVPSPPPLEQPVVIVPASRRARERPWTVEPDPVTPATTAGQTEAARRRYRDQEDHVHPAARLLGSGIFLGGNAPTATRVARLDVGDRYGLARVGDELHILGPVMFDPERVVARVPIAGAEIEQIADRLVVQGGEAAPTMVIAFAGLAVSRGTDVVAVLRAASDEAAG